jgi:hypothetical protein
MNMETAMVAGAAMIPFLSVWALIVVADRARRRREECVARQVLLTDAIHRELGAAAAPEVRGGGSGEWIVSVRLPLQREGLVGAIARITYEVFRRLDRQEPPRVRLVLLPHEPRPARVALTTGANRAATRLGRAA